MKSDIKRPNGQSPTCICGVECGIDATDDAKLYCPECGETYDRIDWLEQVAEEWKDNAAGLLEQLREQTKSFCTHCGKLFPKGKEGIEQFQKHIAECNNHPLHPLAKSHQELRAAVLAMRSLWPAERWATLSAICRDHPCIDREAAKGE